ncbi:hypothetical protein M408DRAFT_327621 [Serendipita vermifera MAFF 305830]|uniref:G-protein alpha subunit n=1 Tax=Serendipita vermifera MAFF 305830 TaxID=933852 RepID=A0A0C2XR20_SERVB|nr:hypothetical protein M408DRAFT_327621 [Serendipita vermifera MAFF 305830]
MAARSSEDPLTRAMELPKGTTTETRAARHQLEALAKQTSNEIDDWLKRDAAVAKRNRQVRLLLLGQAESGKSTMLKNMRLVYAKEEFQNERLNWPPIIHYNVLRMTATVIRLVEDAILEQDAHPPTRPSASSNDVTHPHPGTFTNEHRVLCLRLKPLLEVEAGMSKHLVQSLYRRPGEEVCVHSYFSWTKHFQSVRHSRADALKTEVKRVLNGSCSTITQLWHDPIVRRLLQDQGFQPEHEAGFFLDELERITALDYEPTDLDVCKARLKTIGITETQLRVRLPFGHTDWVVIDVGGSRTQRAAWKPFFEDVHAIVFLAPLSAFNQTLEEIPGVNRLEDSMLLWTDISSSPLLARAHLILFLNKIDLLRKKLERGIKFGSFVRTYEGPNDCDAVCKYMKKRFLSIYKEGLEKLKESEKASTSRIIKSFFTSALDLTSTREVIMQVESSILHDNLSNSKMI